ncbi:hypothetical protein HK405_009421 [Cladochytrium tenue]|nr:hypothetical protein HK405_009421 [Cladochytrium tenue]
MTPKTQKARRPVARDAAATRRPTSSKQELRLRPSTSIPPPAPPLPPTVARRVLRVFRRACFLPSTAASDGPNTATTAAANGTAAVENGTNDDGNSDNGDIDASELQQVARHLRTIKDLFLQRNYEAIFGAGAAAASETGTVNAAVVSAASNAACASDIVGTDAGEPGSDASVVNAVETSPSPLGADQDRLQLLRVYVAAYSPSRALCYADLFLRVPALRSALSRPPLLRPRRHRPKPPPPLAVTAGATPPPPPPPPPRPRHRRRRTCRVYALGAGSGGELVGMAAAAATALREDEAMGRQRGDGEGSTKAGGLKVDGGTDDDDEEDDDDVNGGESEGVGESGDEDEDEDGGDVMLDVHVQDLADYAHVLDAVVRETAREFAPGTGGGGRGDDDTAPRRLQLRVRTTMPHDPVTALLRGGSGGASAGAATDFEAAVARADLVTALFVLNEVLAAGRRGFVALAAALVRCMRPGALLLVVDSAGSFSEFEVRRAGDGVGGGGSSPSSNSGDASSRTYMVYALLDAIDAFEVVEATNAQWFRLPAAATGLDYPLKLNNMRYFMRLYRRRP